MTDAEKAVAPQAASLTIYFKQRERDYVMGVLDAEVDRINDDPDQFASVSRNALAARIIYTWCKGRTAKGGDGEVAVTKKGKK